MPDAILRLRFVEMGIAVVLYTIIPLRSVANVATAPSLLFPLQLLLRS